MSREQQAQVDELLADYRASRERLAAATRELAAIAERVSSADNAITVTVGRTGELTGCEITAQAYQRYTPAQLGELIVRTTTVAAGRAAARAAELLRPALPKDVDPHAVLSGTGELRPEEIVTRKRKPHRAHAERRKRKAWRVAPGWRTPSRGGAHDRALAGESSAARCAPSGHGRTAATERAARGVVMTGFGVDPGAVHRHGSEISGYGDEVHDVLRALSAELAGIGDCWGADEVGSAFAGQHTELASAALTAMGAAGDRLRDAGERFSATGHEYTSAERDNADRLGRAK